MYSLECRDCSYMEMNNKKSFYSDASYCSYYKTYYDPGSAACSHFSSRNSSGGCYITTIVHDVLGKSDNDVVMNNLRSFRDNVLQKNSKYTYILYEYDTVGPLIANKIYEDNDKNFCNEIYNKYLKPISDMVLDKKYLTAIINYQNLVSNLAIYYGIDNNFYLNCNYDNTCGGHGKALKKV